MSNLSPEDRDFIQLALSVPGPTAADRARIRRALAGAAPLAALGTLSASSKAAGASLGLVKTALVFIVAGSVGSGVVVGVAALQRATPPPPAVAPPRALAPPAPAAPLAPPEPAPEPAPAPEPVPAPQPAAAPIARPGRATHAPRAQAPAPVPAPSVSAPQPRCTLEHEAAVLQSAQRQLGSAPREGLAALDALESECPGGELAEERHAARALALCAVGRRDAGRLELEWLLRNGAKSPALPRVRKACDEP